MISVLIPVYNYDISFLVNGLHQALSDFGPFDEIIIGADGCDEAHIKIFTELEKLDGVKLFISNENIGRAQIRNRMADMAEGSHLIFIDADVMKEGNFLPFIRSYYEQINNAPVICGGTAYRRIPPDDPDRYLRWNYGIHREQKSARKRNRNPYASFSGFNFCIEKDIFLKIRFSEELHKYGHEDTLFGYQLKRAGTAILHIDNPLIHEGIETNRVFIRKTAEGVHNLSLLYDRVTDRKAFSESVRILGIYRIITRLGAAPLMALFYRKYGRKVKVYLTRRKRSTLPLFSLFKLSLFCYYRSVSQAE
jgi:glycosyltransferase involved in cell wall biosynthesis